MAEFQNSTFFDMTSYQLVSDALFQQLRTTPATDTAALESIFQQAFYGADRTPPTVTVATADTSATIVVGLTLKRDTDPTSLFREDWGTRQQALADQAQVAVQYGANANFSTVQTALAGLVPQHAFINTANDAYISTPESRTIWLKLSSADFNTLFGTPLLKVTYGSSSGDFFYAWAGNLSLDSLNTGSVPADAVNGLWVQQSNSPVRPVPTNTNGVTLQGDAGTSLGEGNGATKVGYSPNDIAQAYNFPQQYAEAQGNLLPFTTGPIALVEGSISNSTSLLQAVNDYRTQYLGLLPYTSSEFSVVYNAHHSGSPPDASEVALDISVLAGAAPNSSQILYSNSGSTYFTAYQKAIFGGAAQTLSSSYPEDLRFTPNSPFANAYRELFVDAQLRNISVFLSSGDGGSQSEYGTGDSLVRNTHGIPNAVIVGGTSLSNILGASEDHTLCCLYEQAMASDAATLFYLTSAGLKNMPGSLEPDKLEIFTEAVWNDYKILSTSVRPHDAYITMLPDYTGNEAGTGGVDLTWQLPTYQRDFGLNFAGRGSPDVSALAGGNTGYTVLDPSYINDNSKPLTHTSGGTSAATPLWAALTAQINTVFLDQNLPALGYFNDLIYGAAAISPGAFNDVTIGNNVSGFYYYDGTFPLPDGNNVIFADDTSSFIVATGTGFYAQAGYDLTTGLGSPNGVLLARALSAIAHMQYDGPVETRVLHAVTAASATSDATQSLLVQASGAIGAYEFSAGSQDFDDVAAPSALAWTSRLAQQVLQPDFDAALVRMLDGAAQATPGTLQVNSGDALSATMHGAALGLYQSALTASFGFAAFGGLDAGVTVARPVAVAQTVEHADDTTAVVRMRQNGVDHTSVSFYKVDDLSGTINGVAPGQAGYEALATAHTYLTSTGATSLAAPGYGNFQQAILTGIDSGDLIAMKLVNGNHTYWAFAQANESAQGEHVTHLWNYGLNTWGWEDTYGGGDRDYNDLIVQLDFTSTAGSGYLV